MMLNGSTDGSTHSMVRFVRVGLAAFLIAATGFLIGLVAQGLDWQAGRYVALGIVALGVAVGFVAVLGGIVSFMLQVFGQPGKRSDTRDTTDD